jgi:TRAP-type C4-dicarboxylate transport system permease small subunit
MRVGGLELDADLDPDLMVRLTGLMPDPPTVLARIGGWALAAAACILLAIAGWQLGSETASERSMEQALAIATFGLSEDESGDGSFLAVTFGEGEDDR